MKHLATLTLIAATLPAVAQPDRYGLPACPAPQAELADRTFFLLCHSTELRVPLWTAHQLAPNQPNGEAARPSNFRHDHALTGPIARNADYRNSGWHRGHMVPAEDLAWSPESIRATFLLSNAVPQHPAANSTAWRKVEAHVRHIAATSDATYVFTGPIFAARAIEFIGEGRIAVPTHTFKVVLAVSEGQPAMSAFVVPNAPARGASLDDLATTVDEVERLTNLDFFAALEDPLEDDLESQKQPPQYWNQYPHEKRSQRNEKNLHADNQPTTNHIAPLWPEGIEAANAGSTTSAR